jgi:hypothetical protein
MNTAEIYMEMYRRDLTDSMRNWSQDWAGRSHNFASTNWEQPLPAETAIRLRKRLLLEGHPDLAAKVLLAMLGDVSGAT